MSNGSHTVVLCRIYKVCNGRTIKRTCCACFTRANLQPKMQALEGSTRSRKRKKNKHAKRLAFHKNQPITAETDQIRGAASPSGEQNPLLLWWYYGSKEMEEKEEHQPKDCKKHRDGHLEYFVFWLRSVGPLLLIFFCNCVIWSSNLFR